MAEPVTQLEVGLLGANLVVHLAAILHEKGLLTDNDVLDLKRRSKADLPADKREKMEKFIDGLIIVGQAR